MASWQCSHAARDEAYSRRIGNVRLQRGSICGPPPTDYTVRVIPHYDGVAVPLEVGTILWQR